ncbi:MAG: hypothetical protein NT164_04525 [Verrucomicrobiae bacterium]|nr:hypothetical protein [Verrucomicrobiae bacterium]
MNKQKESIRLVKLMYCVEKNLFGFAAGNYCTRYPLLVTRYSLLVTFSVASKAPNKNKNPV